MFINFKNRPASHNFVQFMDTLAHNANLDMPQHSPAVNITEEADGYQLHVAAPGFAKENFSVTVDNGKLTISAELPKAQEGEEDSKSTNYVRREFHTRSFSRNFTLSHTLDANGISATYTNGILLVNVPKKEEAKPQPARLIEIA